MNGRERQIVLDTFFCPMLDFPMVFVELGACPACGRRTGDI